MVSANCVFFFLGDFTLDINPVLLEDDAVFQCQVGAAAGVAPIRSDDARLTVRVPPEPPVIINGDVLRTTEDRTVDIECVSRGGKPGAEVNFGNVCAFVSNSHKKGRRFGTLHKKTVLRHISTILTEYINF